MTSAGGLRFANPPYGSEICSHFVLDKIPIFLHILPVLFARGAS